VPFYNRETRKVPQPSPQSPAAKAKLKLYRKQYSLMIRFESKTYAEKSDADKSYVE
jgi:hypothetical protein